MFECPECVRAGKEAKLIQDYEDWRIYCATMHSLVVLTVAAAITNKSRMRTQYFICNEHFLSLLLHLTKLHKAQDYFAKPFQCQKAIYRARPSFRLGSRAGKLGWLIMRLFTGTSHSR